MSFLEQGYKVPESSGSYMKFAAGINRFRILSEAKTGFIYFTTENKPVRSRVEFQSTPNIKAGMDGKPTTPRHFWLIVVWNYNENRLQVLELTQKSIMNDINNLYVNDKWGDPRFYDIAVTKSGEGKETRYTVMGEPPIGEPSAEIVAQYKEAKINLDAMFDGGNPFSSQNQQPQYVAPQTDEVKVEDIPF